jgi:hypothetical protein
MNLDFFADLADFCELLNLEGLLLSLNRRRLL